MKKSAFISLLYGIIVILSGVTTFSLSYNLVSLLEGFFGIILLINVYFLMKNKKLSFYVLFVLSFLLTIFYGYDFSQTNNFFPALLTAISFFVFIFELLRILKVFKEE